MTKQIIHGCGAIDKNNGCYDEVDGQEFQADSLDELVRIIKQYGFVHLNYLLCGDVDIDLDVWVKHAR